MVRTIICLDSLSRISISGFWRPVEHRATGNYSIRRWISRNLTSFYKETMNTTKFLNSTTSEDLSLTLETTVSLAIPLGKCNLKKMRHNAGQHFFDFKTGLMFIMGTFIKLRMIQHLKCTPRSTSTTIQIDDMVLFEQIVNAINGPLILVQIAHVLFSSYTRVIFGNIVFCSIWTAFSSITLIHRAIGGFGIAIVRQVSCLSECFQLLSHSFTSTGFSV